jgi:hypothetical protein
MPMLAQRGGGGIAPTHPNLGTGMGELSTPRPGCFTHGKYPVPNVQEAGWALGPILKMSPPTGIKSPDRPARSESLYRIRCPGIYTVPCLKYS